MSEVNQALLNRVRNLLTLSRGTDSPTEAQSAAAAATRLMERHRITEAQLATAESERARIDQEPVVRGRSIASWQNQLADHVATANHCIIVRRRFMAGNRWTHSLLLIGRPTDTAAARIAFTQLASATLELRPKQARLRRDFLLGVVEGIGMALRAAREQARADASPTALAIVDQRDEEIRRIFPLGLSTETRKIRVGPAYRVGMTAGVVVGSQHVASRKKALS